MKNRIKSKINLNITAIIISLILVIFTGCSTSEHPTLGVGATYELELVINPMEYHSGQQVRIEPTINNVGTEDGTYNLEIYVDDALFRSSTAEIPAGGHGTWLEFYNITPDTTLGMHNVRIGTVTVHFWVVSGGVGTAVIGLTESTTTATTTASTSETITPLTVTSTTLAEGVVAKAYTADIRPGGGKIPYSYSLTSGSLPPGLSISEHDDYASITGTPTQYGVYTFEMTVDDTAEATEAVKATYKIIIIPNLQGTWQFTIKITQASGVCGEEVDHSSSHPITITQNGREVIFAGFLGNADNRLNGEIVPPHTSSHGIVNDTDKWIVQVSGGYWEDGGTTTSTHRLTINTITAMEGIEYWSWYGDGGGCPDGQADVTAVKNLVP